MLRCAIYARVSKGEKQETLNQLEELREFARISGWSIIREYTDEESGRTGNRPAFQRLLDDASRRKFDVVLFWALDRFSRQGTLETLQYLKRLTDYGVKFRSFTQQYLDTCGAFGDVVISLFAVMAKQEAFLISERTKAGLARARKAGRRLGRPAADVDLKKFAAAVRRNDTLQVLKRDFRISLSTAQRLRKATHATPRNG